MIGQLPVFEASKQQIAAYRQALYRKVYRAEPNGSPHQHATATSLSLMSLSASSIGSERL